MLSYMYVCKVYVNNLMGALGHVVSVGPLKGLDVE